MDLDAEAQPGLVFPVESRLVFGGSDVDHGLLAPPNDLYQVERVLPARTRGTARQVLFHGAVDPRYWRLALRRRLVNLLRDADAADTQQLHRGILRIERRIVEEPTAVLRQAEVDPPVVASQRLDDGNGGTAAEDLAGSGATGVRLLPHGHRLRRDCIDTLLLHGVPELHNRGLFGRARHCARHHARRLHETHGCVPAGLRKCLWGTGGPGHD
mmetsp:Transcript_51113/g.147471  ORF Transcript_51113/g.147471 Transcript_51113/m.147471 type:complete len:213 (+) Transcript_51113:795-1433(+)